MEGGAANLVRILKGLVGAQIPNRVIALFDNDTAASVTLRSFKNASLPSNYRICQYPNLEYAREYPTIGPQGTVPGDVNGLAGSIELYFGVDILRDEVGQLTPVQWRGFDQTLGQYQGELIRKHDLQRAFETKLDKANNASAPLDDQDWSGMSAIWSRVFDLCPEIA